MSPRIVLPIWLVCTSSLLYVALSQFDEPFVSGDARSSEIRLVKHVCASYTRGVPLSQLFAYITVMPPLVFIAVVGAFLRGRDRKLFLLLSGWVAAYILTDILKAIINQKRPSTSTRTSPGMPSNHAQFISFFATFCTLYACCSRHRSTSSWWDALERQLCALSMSILAVGVCISRIVLGEHSVEQVVAGFALGIFLSSVWFVIVDRCCDVGTKEKLI